MLPLIVGTQLTQQGKDVLGLTGLGIRWIFELTEKVSYIYIFIHNKTLKIIQLILNKLRKVLNLKEKVNINFRNNSMSTLIAVFSTISIISLIYFGIGFSLFPNVYTSLKELILNNLSTERISFSFIITVILDGLGSFHEIVRTELWILKLCIFIIISIAYISTIYNGLVKIDQIKNANIYIPVINRELKTKFNIKVLSIYNIGILSLMAFIASFLIKYIPAFDSISAILTLLNIFNIEISVTSVIAITLPVLVEKIGGKIINNISSKNNWKSGVKEINVFSKKSK